MGACLSGKDDSRNHGQRFVPAPAQGPAPPTAYGAQVPPPQQHRQQPQPQWQQQQHRQPRATGRAPRQAQRQPQQSSRGAPSDAPAVGSVVTAGTHTASASIRNGTLKVTKRGGGGFDVACVVDSTAPRAVVRAYVACMECGGAPGGPAVVFRPQQGVDEATAHQVPPRDVPAGNGHEVAFSVTVPEQCLVSDAGAGRYPVVVAVELDGGREQRVAYVQMASPESAPDLTRHVMVRDGGMFLLKDVYGEQEDAAECVVCLCEAPEAVIMPCRHKCVCLGCAEALRGSGGGKCPMCRAEIQYYVKAGAQ